MSISCWRVRPSYGSPVVISLAAGVTEIFGSALVVAILYLRSDLPNSIGAKTWRAHCKCFGPHLASDTRTLATLCLFARVPRPRSRMTILKRNDTHFPCDSAPKNQAGFI